MTKINKDLYIGDTGVKLETLVNFRNMMNTAMVVNGSHDLNDYVNTGIFSCGGIKPLNSPNNIAWTGVLLVFKSYYILQIIILSGGGIWTRVKYETFWNAWYKINADS